MNPPDWKSLVVSVNERSAIYAEHFPGILARADESVFTWFSDDQARHVLFAGAWPSLARDADHQSARSLYLSDGSFVCRFRGVQLTPHAIVVDEMTIL